MNDYNKSKWDWERWKEREKFIELEEIREKYNPFIKKVLPCFSSSKSRLKVSIAIHAILTLVLGGVGTKLVFYYWYLYHGSLLYVDLQCVTWNRYHTFYTSSQPSTHSTCIFIFISKYKTKEIKKNKRCRELLFFLIFASSETWDERWDNVDVEELRIGIAHWLTGWLASHVYF